jgi:type II secretory pathway component PulF
MPGFHYKAVDEQGAAIAGVLIADSVEDARERLRRMHLFPESVEPSAKPAAGLLSRLPSSKARANANVAIFTRQFAVLLASGVPAVDALRVLADQTEYKPLSEALHGAAEAASGGSSVAAALAEYPRFFDAAYVGMVTSGEKSGTLDTVFLRMADFLERRRLMQSRISTALIYPSLLLVMVIALLVFLAGHVVPNIKPLLEYQNRPLPLVTRILFALGDLAQGWWWVLPVVGVLLFALAGCAHRSRWRETLDALVFRTPVFGRIWLKSVISRFAMSFATLLRTGVPAVEALESLEGIISNEAFSKEIRRVRMDVIEGKDISGGLRGSRLFPPMVGYMIAVGERSGNLADVLEHVSRSHDTEVDIASQRLLAVLEPVLILVMALAVGFIAMSLMVTIMEISRI